jgi:hypothetical protein
LVPPPPPQKIEAKAKAEPQGKKHILSLSGSVHVHCKSEGLRKYFYQVYGTLQISIVHFCGNINKKA